MQASSFNDYSNQSFPVQYRPTLADIQTVTWCDNYVFKQLPMIGSNYDFPPIPPGGSTSNSFVSNVKGMVTGSLERVDGMPGLDLVTVNYYDNRLRLICSVSDNHLGGRNNGFFGYNFSNEITESITTHYVNGQASEQIVLITQYTYGHQGRLLEEKLKLNGNDYITLKALQYNEIGDVINTYLHSSANGRNFNQKIANTYNIRGWLRKMNDPDDIGHNLFALDLRYQNPGGPAAIHADPRYNGNITQMRWNSKYDLPRAYGFSYDPLNRLTAARYGQGNAYNSNAGHFNTTYAYDANGNITNLTRKQENTLIDALTYTYDGNRLNNVNDQGTTDGYVPYTTGNYQYYPNGNLMYDPSKKIEVYYNHLNLPNLIVFDNDDNITYAYSATGAKLRKTITTSKTATGGVTDYSGPFLYHDNQLSCIFTPAGRIVPLHLGDDVLWKYEYNLSDHLGNVRVVFAAHSHGQPEVMQQTSYYPFGMTLQQQNFGGLLSQPNKLLYNSKELQDDELAGSRLDWYDYGARFYDAQLGRWHVVDPLAEKYYSISSYVYVANNPIKYIDPDGREIWLYQYDDDGNRVAELQYTPGMEYDGDNAYFSNAITTLNQMNTVEIGSAVLGELHGSMNIFGVTNQSTSIEGGHQFVENSDGGGILKMGENFRLEGMAHEIFHGYQHERGQSGASIFNEVEANLFGFSVAFQYASDNLLPFGSATPMGNTSEAGRTFENSFNQSLQSNSFSREHFISAVQNFQGGSMRNASGGYNRYPLQRSNQKTSLISRFYPLMR